MFHKKIVDGLHIFLGKCSIFSYGFLGEERFFEYFFPIVNIIFNICFISLVEAE